MVSPRAEFVLRHVRAALARQHIQQRTDGDLLRCFSRERDEDAFAELVRRHGPMVLAVCRRVLHDAHDAEDAFQATFLILARKAKARGWRESAAGWLYLVAHRLAVRMRSDRQRHRREQPPVRTTSVDPLETVSGRELCAAVDEELNRMPERLRAGIVLCCLQGSTRDEAARALGWSLGTLKRRLEQGRALLRTRLQKRGIELPAALAGLLVADGVGNAVVPPALAQTVVTAATTGSVMSANVVALVETVLSAGMFSRLRVAAVVLVAVSLVGGIGLPFTLGPSGVEQKHATLVEPSANQSEPDRLPPEVVARMGSPRMRHPGGVGTLALSPDGKWLASAGLGEVRVWDTATGKLRRRWEVIHLYQMRFVAAGTDLELACVSTAKQGKVIYQRFAVSSGKELQHVEWPAAKPPQQMALSPDGRRIAVGWRNPWLRVYDAPSGREVIAKQLPLNSVYQLEFSHDGKTLAVIDPIEAIHLLDATTGEPISKIRPAGESLAALSFSPDGRLVSVVYRNPKSDYVLSVWDRETGKEKYTLAGPDLAPITTQFSPDGKQLAISGHMRDVLLVDAVSGKEMQRLRADIGSIALAFSSDSKTLAVGGNVGILSLWDTKTGKRLPQSADLSIPVYDLRFARQGKELIGNAGAFVVWDRMSGRELRRYPDVRRGRWFAQLSPDEKMLAGADKDGTIRLWDTATNEEIRTLKGHGEEVWGMAFSPDGKRLISSSYDLSIRVWNVATGRELHKLAGHPDPIDKLAVSPDGRWLVSANAHLSRVDDYDIRIWDLTTAREVRRLRPRFGPVRCLLFSPDGSHIVSSGGELPPHAIQIWDTATGKEIRAIESPKEYVSCMAISPDGRMLATGSWGDGTLRLWELATGRERHHFDGHQCEIDSVAFSPDGRSLAASSVEAPVYLWEVIDPHKPRHELNRTETEHVWSDLATEDDMAAFRAIRRLVRAPETVHTLFKKHLAPALVVDPDVVRGLLRDLDSDDFETRKKAQAELEKIADRCPATLRKTAEETTSAEVRRRLKQILNRLDHETPESLRAIRAVEVLEHLATPEARQLLRKLADGAAEARLTREAKAALERLQNPTR